MKGPLRVDLHVHSRYSPDSRLDLKAIAARLPLLGLRGFALTDHNTVAGHAELRELARQHPEYLFVPGVEVSTREGHLLAYGLDSPPPRGEPIEATIGWISDRGGVAVPSHPFRRSHGVGAAVLRRIPVPAIETRNGHNPEIPNARAELLAAERCVGSTGGSDAHDARDVGRSFTLFPDDVSSVGGLLEALRSGRSTGEGRSLAGLGLLRLSVHTAFQRVARGFRSV